MTTRISFQTLRHAVAKGRHALPAATRAFRRDENGGATIMALVFFLIMIAAGGIAVDMMRYEMKRAQIQSTLDSAVLASAGAPYGSDHRAIIEDYFRVANMTDYLAAEKEGEIVVTVNSASVTANADMTMDTYLMKLSGIKELRTTGGSTAVRKVPKLEVVLVLDVSGSMGSNSKLVNLKKAAKEFVTSLLNGSEPGNTVISIVPFSWSVSPSVATFEALAVDRKHEFSTCIRFKANDHSHASLATGNSGFSNGQPLDQMIYTALYGNFDEFSGSESSSDYRSCYANDYMEILPFSVSETELHAKIDSLQASGNTSGNQGMIWGAALLDPSFRQITDDLIAAGEVASSQAAIPSNYGTAETLKVAVVMGDGQNTTSYFFSTGGQWRGQNSDLYEVKSQKRVFKYAYRKNKKDKISYDQSKCSNNSWECVYESSGEIESAFYLHDNYDDNRYYNTEEGEYLSSSEWNDLQDSDEFVSMRRLDWEEAWGYMSPYYYYQVTGDPNAYYDYYYYDRLDGSEKDTRMKASCTATKNEGVVVFSIGFEIDQGGTAEQVLKNCASSENHYFRAEGININDAFSAIASNVVNLRLTQ